MSFFSFILLVWFDCRSPDLDSGDQGCLNGICDPASLAPEVVEPLACDAEAGLILAHLAAEVVASTEEIPDLLLKRGDIIAEIPRLIDQVPHCHLSRKIGCDGGLERLGHLEECIVQVTCPGVTRKPGEFLEHLDFFVFRFHGLVLLVCWWAGLG
jgi:hypothetical protein